jgi:D-sedoheptulose 7-phosphate isomerase
MVDLMSELVTPPTPSLAIIPAHLSNVRSLLNQVPMLTLERIVEVFARARDEGAFIYIAGNGGSSATASHWVNDLGKATKRSGRPPMRVICLSDNTSWFSALANDEGYDRVFSGQLENFAKPRDVLVCISASGNSANLLRAVDVATDRGMTTVGLLGFDGGALKSRVDVMLCVSTEKGAYELVEDIHSVLCHAITKCLIADRADTCA